MNATLLLDTNAPLFRAHYALPPMNTRRGEPKPTVSGFCLLLLRLRREELRAPADRLDRRHGAARRGE